MNRSQRRRNKKEEKKILIAKKLLTFTLREKVILISFGLLIIISSCYVSFKDHNDYEIEYETIDITFKSKPKFEKWRGNREINFYSNEYKKQFIVSNFNYEASNKHAILNDFNINDKVTLEVDKNEVKNLNNESFFDKTCGVYKLYKNGYNYIDSNMAENYYHHDYKYFFIISISGIILIVNAFNKNVKENTFENVITISILFGIVTSLILTYFF